MWLCVHDDWFGRADERQRKPCQSAHMLSVLAALVFSGSPSTEPRQPVERWLSAKAGLKQLTPGDWAELVDKPDPDTGDLLTARVKRVQQLRAEISDHLWLNQYANHGNPRAQYELFREVTGALGGKLDYVFVAASTCGTLRGCRDFVRDQGMRTKVIAVDAVGSVIFGGVAGPRLLPGHGAARRPELYEPGLEDETIYVNDQECVAGCFRLLRAEAVFAGGSSGAVISAIEKMRSRIPAGATVAAVLCDRGDRYLDTIYSEPWVAANFGPGFQPWQTGSAAHAS